MITQHLIPSVEKRITAWKELKERKVELADVALANITISREFGCEGYPLAEALQQILTEKSTDDWMIYDDALIKSLQADQDLSQHLLKNYGERNKFLDDLMDMIASHWQSEEDGFRQITQFIYSLAKKGHGIFVGRGAFSVIKNLDNCYHIRLKAPLSFRAQKLSKRLKISEDEATNLAVEKEIERTRFIKRFLNTDFESDHFHVIYDNQKMTVNEMAENFLQFVGEIK
ncbi:MAG: cytidylate kinase-like family protein [Deltaproteobacteria bacterium]|jgi:cytidylate kinase|nr:cytidylate kinase-like family protein [Deltaproteobacteria bacterium]MBT4525138.1 cytidylate kinase-like family protein [Deltaproteobacteria bacterium]